MPHPIREAAFPVAGVGTRFLPATKAMPKELLPIIDRPNIQYAVEEAVAAGITGLIFVTGRAKRVIEGHFDANPEPEIALREKGKDAMASSLSNKFFLPAIWPLERSQDANASLRWLPESFHEV